MIGRPPVKVQETVYSELNTHQICNNSFDLVLHHLHVFGGTLQGDPVFSLGELNVHLHAKYPTIISYKINSKKVFKVI